ncbi:unnamed protein product [Ceratitis capitata]|uniref:(Mediterranean fruit fly) hypothetical protein n=1 Tax=Ceratitis capitata TaxID=7213 RepID=A0A811V1J3_CERCA|nr:unnamed protein product [Ceratitis capitata]
MTPSTFSVIFTIADYVAPPNSSSLTNWTVVNDLLKLQSMPCETKLIHGHILITESFYYVFGQNTSTLSQTLRCFAHPWPLDFGIAESHNAISSQV